MPLLNYKPLPLTDIAVRRLVANLFKKATVLLSINNFHSKYPTYYYETDYNSLKVWEETVEVKLLAETSKLGLPKSLSQKLIGIVRPMGEQVKSWKEFHEEYLRDSHGEALYFDITILEKLRWTTAGAVDYKETAIELICSDVVDIAKKFKLACLYCLEDYIPMLWRELPKENKRCFCSIAEVHLQNGGLGQEFWWPYIIQGQESELDDLTKSYRRDQVTFHQHAFQCSVHKGNKTAAEHFLQKLTNEEKKATVMRVYRERHFLLIDSYNIFPMEKCFELLGYLLSIITADQQVQILEEKPLDVLEWFLVWPLQNMFLEIADNIWNIISEVPRDFMLFFMYEYSEKLGNDSLKLFQEFFLHVSSDFWLSFVERHSTPGSLFDIILVSQDIKTLEIWFRSLDAPARKRLIFSETAINAFKKFISNGKPDVVEVCIGEARLSHEDRQLLKEILQLGLKPKTRKWSGLFHLLNERNYDGKRCSVPRIEPAAEAKKRKI